MYTYTYIIIIIIIIIITIIADAVCGDLVDLLGYPLDPVAAARAGHDRDAGHLRNGNGTIRDNNVYTTTNKCLQCLLKTMYTVF